MLCRPNHASATALQRLNAMPSAIGTFFCSAPLMSWGWCAIPAGLLLRRSSAGGLSLALTLSLACHRPAPAVDYSCTVCCRHVSTHSLPNSYRLSSAFRWSLPAGTARALRGRRGVQPAGKRGGCVGAVRPRVLAGDREGDEPPAAGRPHLVSVQRRPHVSGAFKAILQHGCPAARLSCSKR